MRQPSGQMPRSRMAMAVADQAGVAEHHALGLAGGAAGVEDAPAGRSPRAARVLGSGSCGQQIGQIQPAVARRLVERDQLGAAARPANMAALAATKPVADQDDSGFAVLDGVGVLSHAPAGVQRRDDRRQPRAWRDRAPYRGRELADRTATRSPSPTPRARRPPAIRAAWSSKSRQDISPALEREAGASSRQAAAATTEET